MAKKIFTLPAIAKRADAEYRTLKSWQDRGLITPSVHADTGAGRQNLYSEHDAEVAISLVNLRCRGLDMVALRVVAAAWRTGKIPECPICHRSELKVPVIDPPRSTDKGGEGS